MDVHDSLLTVREALRFSATLRQEEDVSLEDKYAYVEEVLSVCMLVKTNQLFANLMCR